MKNLHDPLWFACVSRENPTKKAVNNWGINPVGDVSCVVSVYLHPVLHGLHSRALGCLKDGGNPSFFCLWYCHVPTCIDVVSGLIPFKINKMPSRNLDETWVLVCFFHCFFWWVLYFCMYTEQITFCFLKHAGYPENQGVEDLSFCGRNTCFIWNPALRDMGDAP